MPNCHGKHNTTDNFLAKSSVRIEREILNAKNVCNEHGSASSVFTLHRVDDIERTKESEIAADGWELTKYLNFLKARALLENKIKKSCKIVHILIYWTLLCACAYRIIDYPKHGGSIVGTWVNNEHEETGNIELELLF